MRKSKGFYLFHFLESNIVPFPHILKSTGFQSRGLISTDEIGQPFVNISENL